MAEKRKEVTALKKNIKLRVNGTPYEMEIEPRITLAELLRERLFLTGTKMACESGVCGACTVILNGKAVKSCLILAVKADGKEVLTIEGLASDVDNLHPLQASFIRNGAIQCGFCTPGLILSAKAFIDENPRPNEEDLRAALVGNLCRCTGYVKPIKAIMEVTRAKNEGR
ncbi:MAG: (2Fe-2S)-binding protein [Thermodesulfobacteriota bacterium]|nr:(2Fe-2S)-binding protein [Thermodesulfobacteriota bacterium]